MQTILGDLTEEVHGLSKACDGISCAIIAISCVCVISAMDDGNCSPA